MEYSIVTDASLIEKTKWAEFVNRHPHGNIFQTPQMYEVYKSTKNYEPLIVICLDRETLEVAGVLLAVIQKQYSGWISKLSARAIVWGGPLVKNNNKEVLIKLLEVFSQIVKHKSIYTEVRNLTDQAEFKEIFLKFKFKYIPHLNILLALEADEEILWTNLKNKERKVLGEPEKTASLLARKTTSISSQPFFDC